MDTLESSSGDIPPGGHSGDHLPVRWAWVWLAWLAVTLLFIVQNVVGAVAAGFPVDPQWAVVHELIYFGVWAALTPAIVAWARRHPPGRGAGLRPWLAHLGMAALIAPVQTALTYLLHMAGLLALGRLSPASAGGWLGDRTAAFLVISLTGLWKYAVVVGVYYAFDFHHRYRRQEREGARLALRAAELESRWAEARLDALRVQLHPHFLFNTLNSIAVLNREDPERAIRMLLRLSDLLRTALEVEEREVSLRRELEIARQYMEIQVIRYEERIRLEIDVEPAAEGAAVPAFLLQPILENAIRHGVERGPGTHRIRLAARAHEGRLRLEVENPLVAAASGATGSATPGGPASGSGSFAPGDPGRGSFARGGPGRARRGGIGLANIRERLEHAFGADQSFLAGPCPERGTFRVRIEFPQRSVIQE